MRILLVEDNTRLADLLTQFLSKHYIMDSVTGLAEACDYIDQLSYDVVLLDRNLDDKDVGLSLISKIKTKNPTTGVIVISAYGSIADKISGLDLGADDYLEKPFDNEELRARICALIRRNQGLPKVIIEEMVCDTLKKTISYKDEEISLSKKESQLFFYLLQQRSKIVSKEELLNALYLNPENISSNTIDVTLAHVRKKLPLPLIKTIKTRGYIID